MSDGGFLSRWSQRKAAVKQGVVSVEPASTPHPSPLPASGAREQQAIPSLSPGAGRGTEGEGPAQQAPAAPTLDEAAALTRDSDFRRFVTPEVDPQVRNTALKKLFADPQFNVMDGLDTYIDDYGKPDPLPASMLRQMASARALGLFDEDSDDEKKQAAAPQRADPDGALADTPSPSVQETTRVELPNDDDAAVRLQPDDAAGPPGARDGAGRDAGRER